MAKRLLSKDYYQIVIDALLLPEKDVDKYYYNIVEKRLNDNPDLFTELKEVLNDWIEWYKGQARGGTFPAEIPDGTIKYFDRNQTWESDEDEDYTKWVKHDLYEQKISLPLTTPLTVWVNKAYFENHLTIIESIEREKKIKKLEIESNFLERIMTNLENVIQSRAVSIPQLTTDLTADQIIKLYKLLVKGEFIPETPDKDCFNWAFGNPDEKQPEQWQPIMWNKNKQLLRELLDHYKSSKFKLAEIECIVPLLFVDRKGKPFTLAGNKPVPSSDSDLIIEIIKKIATSLTT